MPIVPLMKVFAIAVMHGFSISPFHLYQLILVFATLQVILPVQVR